MQTVTAGRRKSICKRARVVTAHSSYVDKNVTDLGSVTVSVSVTVSHGILYKVERMY